MRSDTDRHRRVGMKTVLLRDEIEIHQIAGLNGAIAGNAVNRFVVNADALSAWKAVHQRLRRALALSLNLKSEVGHLNQLVSAACRLESQLRRSIQNTSDSL